MKIHEYNQMMKHLTRPPDKLSKTEKKKIVEDFYKKADQPKPKAMGIVPYIKKMNYLYGNGNEDDPDTPSQMNPKYIDPLEMQKIKEAIPVSPMVKEEERFNDKILKRDKYAPKKVVKKPLPNDWKPKYLNGNVIDITPLLDDEWWSIFGEDPPKEESRLLLVPKSKAEGIRSILNLHKKFVG